MPPPMAGFIEFALMRTRGDIDQKYLSELYYQYMNVEEDFVKDLFFATETRLGRVYVQEPVLTNDKTNHILDYERATHIVEEAQYIGVGTCYCRHKAYHAGHPCEIDAPWDVCLTFDNVARSLAENGGYARLISKEEAKEVLERSYASNLVQIGGKCPGASGIYLQLLRMLLRGPAGCQKVCAHAAGGDHQLYSRSFR